MTRGYYGRDGRPGCSDYNRSSLEIAEKPRRRGEQCRGRSGRKRRRKVISIIHRRSRSSSAVASFSSSSSFSLSSSSIKRRGISARGKTSGTSLGIVAAVVTMTVSMTITLFLSSLSVVHCFHQRMPVSVALKSPRVSTMTTTTTITTTSMAASSSSSSRSFSKRRYGIPVTEKDEEEIMRQRVVGDWEEMHGNYLLRPRNGNDAQPRALIHFLGGAIVGSAPQVSYRYLLERLADDGYLVVATPYDLSFDHLSTCDDVIHKFERIAMTLARTYGALPVVGMGHSCGALLQLLITSLFPDTPRGANVLISFNNKPVSEAVPAFEEIVAPFFTYASAKNATDDRHSGSEVISVALQLAKYAAIGHVPTDQLLVRASQLLVPPSWLDGLHQQRDGAPPPPSSSNSFKSSVVDKLPLLNGKFVVPDEVRETLSRVAGPSKEALSEAGLLQFSYEFFDTLEQIPLLIDEVADGARDFVPPPDQVKAAARRAYRARKTLLVKYDDDNFDETDDIEELLLAAGQVTRMKRPMVPPVDVRVRTVPGGHATPLLAPPLDFATRVETLMGVDAAKEQLQYVNADQTVREITGWLEESNL